MKKVISSLLVLVICFGMCACSFVTKQTVIGTWEPRIASKPDLATQVRFIFYKGGTGLIKNPLGNTNLTWEIKDGVLLVCMANLRTVGYQYNPKEDTFTSMDGHDILVRVS